VKEKQLALASYWLKRERIGLTLTGLAVVVLILALLAPRDATLRDASPVIYLHGALVWTAILTFTSGGLLGLAALIWRKDLLHAWSGALARTGLLFWVLYLPVSMWASKVTWNGVPLGDPRFRTAFQILVLAAGFQVAATLWGARTRLGSGLNVLLAVALWVLTLTTQDVMHPENPMRSSAPTIQFFFALLVGGCGLAALQVARWMRPLDD
jgi:hypothetical protein